MPRPKQQIAILLCVVASSVAGPGCGDDETSSDQGNSGADGGSNATGGSGAAAGSDASGGSGATGGSNSGGTGGTLEASGTYCGNGTTPSDEAARASASPLDGMGSVEKLVCDLVAAEGPVWNEGALLFSDVQANTLYRFEEPNALSVYLQPSDYANGLAIDIDGGLLRAETGGQGLMTKRVSHLLAGETTVLADEYTGLPFNTPNDIAVRSDGTIYFTDPGFSLLDEDVQLGFRGVFRIAPDKSLHAEVEGPLNGRPNGIILSLDESLLYFADTMSNNIMSAVVQTDGSLATPTIFATAAKSPDGMTIDSVGNVFVAGGGDVEAFAPDGSSWGSISIESSARNVTFGGADKKSLYVTAKTGLYRVRMPIAGN